MYREAVSGPFEADRPGYTHFSSGPLYSFSNLVTKSVRRLLGPAPSAVSAFSYATGL